MNMPAILTRKHLSRRMLLRGAGVSMALPWLEAMTPPFARDGAGEPPRRFVSLSLGLGFHGPNLFPEKAGRGYEPSVYLKEIADLRDDFTVFSGVSHPGVNAGHQAEACILSAAPISAGGTGGFRNSISIDQLMARHLGGETRFPSLVLNLQDNTSPSYTENGAMIPAEKSAAKVFAKLFIDDTPGEQRKQSERLKQGRGIMDIVGADARALERSVGPGDKRKLDAYFTSVRELEQRLAANQKWAFEPKPKVAEPASLRTINLSDLRSRQRAMLDIVHLALETDSTRFVTVHIGGANEVVPVEGVSEGYHNLSHHGLDPDKLAQLTLVEKTILGVWGEFLRKQKASREGVSSVLDRTMNLLTSNLGNASAHDTKNMPVVFAGGGFRHGQHLAFDRKDNYPLTNLYVQMLQRAGLEQRSFVSSTAESVKGFETL
jgi:hypothetical protein